MPMAILCPGAHLLQFLAQQPCAVLLHVDFALKIQAVAHLHEFVRIARVTIFAGKLASSIGIDLPGEGHTGRITAREHAAILQRDVVHLVPFRNRFALGRKPGNADEGSLRFGLRRRVIP